MTSSEKDSQFLDKSLIYGNVFMSGLSLVFSIAMPLFIYFHKRLRSLSYIILGFIGISEIFQSIGYFISLIPPSNIRCLCAQIFVIFSDSWTMLLLSILSYCTYSLVIKNDRKIYNQAWRYIWISLIFGSTYALIIFLLHCFLVVQKDSAGLLSDNWCKNYIKIMGLVDSKEKNLKTSIPYYLINWAMVVYICVLYFKIRMYMKKKSREDPVNACKIMAICNSLAYYPLFGFLGWGITTLFLFFSRSNENSPMNHLKLMLMYLAGIFVCLRGFLISIMFFTSEKIWSIIKLKWKMLSKPLSKINFLQFNHQNSKCQINDTLF